MTTVDYWFDEAWASMVETDYEQTMERLWDAVDDEGDVETPSGLPFCGCTTCTTRETLWLIVGHTLTGQATGKCGLGVRADGAD